MDLGYGFTSGINRISKQKVCYWLHTDSDITWDSFVWYIADYCDIEDFGEDCCDKTEKGSKKIMNERKTAGEIDWFVGGD